MPTGIFKPTYVDRRTGETRQTKTWWVRYNIDGERFRESSKSTRQRDAIALRARRLQERGQGIDHRDVEKTTIVELAEALRTDYANNQLKSAVRMEAALAHILRAFRGWRAVQLTSASVDKYKKDRIAEGMAPGTVNIELAILGRMFRLGLQHDKVARVPRIERFRVDNVRKGFCEPSEVALLLQELPRHHAAWVNFSYLTGWRAADEVWPLEWSQVDLGEDGWIRLNDSKNKTGRECPIVGPLRELLEDQRRRVTALEKEHDTIVRYVFPAPTGRQIKHAMKAWKAACERAGLGGKLPHDLRRSCVRNLERSGVPRSVAMALVGHKSESIYRRYAIIDATLLREGAQKLAAFHESTKAAAKSVLPFEGPSQGQVRAKTVGTP